MTGELPRQTAVCRALITLPAAADKIHHVRLAARSFRETPLQWRNTGSFLANYL